MKKILLASVATVALSLPVMAQKQDMQPNTQNEPQRSQTQQPSGTSQSEMNKPSTNESTQSEQQKQQGQSQQQQSQQESEQQQQQAQEPVDPSNLSKDEVRKIQQTLNEKGFKVNKVDGVWGPNTEAALRKFQEENNIKVDGQLTQETIAELEAAKGADSSGTTGAGSSSTNSSDQDQNPPKESGSGSSQAPIQSHTPESKGQSQQ